MTLEEKIELMARYLEASAWSIWEGDDELTKLREIEKEVYQEWKHKSSFSKARLEGYKAVLRAVFGEEKLLTAEEVLAEVDKFCEGRKPNLAPYMREHYKTNGYMAHAVLQDLNLEPVTMWRMKKAEA